MSSKKERELVAFNSIVTCDMLNQQVIFHFGETGLLGKQLKPYLKKTKLRDILKVIERDKEKGTVLGKTINLGKGTLVYLYSIPHDEKGYSVLVHEIYHATMMVMKKIGIEYSSEGEEAYAYLVGFLTNEILHELKEKKLISFS